MLYMQS